MRFQNNMRSIIARNGLGRAYAKQTKYELAPSQYLEALEMVGSYFRKDHVLGADIMKNLGKAYLAMGKIEEAKDLWTRAEKVYTAAFGATNVLAIECKGLVDSMLVKDE
jgi:tetratricopeptide (TPR) repeat protein